MNNDDTIVALATASGTGAIAVIRLSGSKAFDIAHHVFQGKDITKTKSHTIHFGHIVRYKQVIDEVLVSVFRGPNSFTKEDVIEISTHGSPFVVQQVMELLIDQGARPAEAGEFTKRAFLNGRFDLAQAEAVADLINSDSAAAHKTAMNQMRGGFSDEIKELRAQLVQFASLVELELDFGEEDVEFADRGQLYELVRQTHRAVFKLLDSFRLGNVLKEGIPTVIAGRPNAGKSTLLNCLLNEERAIVSDVPGTTRDIIEDEISLEGIKFRFIDTAGLRETIDKVEAIGVERTRERMKKAALVMYIFDVNNAVADGSGSNDEREDMQEVVDELSKLEVPFILVGNKIDLGDTEKFSVLKDVPMVYISAGEKQNLDELKDSLLEAANLESISSNSTVVTNARHYTSLRNTQQSLEKVMEGMDLGITGDLLAEDIRMSLHHLGEITGEITTDDLLDNIFSKFCIGK